MAARTASPSTRFTVSPESLRWGIGFFCSILGAFVLVAPHRFAAPPYQALAPYRGFWGSAAFAAGVALLAVAVVRPRAWVSAAVHAMAAGVLGLLAVSFGQSRIWPGIVSYGLLGLATLVAGLLPPERTVPRDMVGRDLYALCMALIGVLNGLFYLFGARLLGAYYDAARDYLPWLGAAYLAGGLLLGWVQLRPPGASSPGLIWAAHGLAGAAFIAAGVQIALPRLAWTGLFLSLGGGAVLVLLPWLSRVLGRIDTASLRTRLALALATATSVGLVLAVAVTTRQEERQATAQVLEMRQAEAEAIARHVA